MTSVFDAAWERHVAAVADLVPLLVEMALASIAEVLPGASVLETEGEMNEDWVFTLRIQRVLDAGGEVLYDVDAGHEDAEVETMIDEVGVEYLDLLLELTGDEYLGRKTVVRAGAGGALMAAHSSAASERSRSGPTPGTSRSRRWPPAPGRSVRVGSPRAKGHRSGG